MGHRIALFIGGIVVLTGGVCLYLAFAGSSVAEVASSEAKLILYWEPDFRGPSLEVTGTLFDMPVITDELGAEFDWNDQVRSLVVVSGTWRLHEDGRCNTQLDDTPLEELDITEKELVEGWTSLISASSLGPLEIPNCAAGGLSHDISSIQLVSEENLPDWALPSH